MLILQISQYNMYYIMLSICRLAVGTNKGLAVIDTENNTVLHILSSLTSLLCKSWFLGWLVLVAVVYILYVCACVCICICISTYVCAYYVHVCWLGCVERVS